MKKIFIYIGIFILTILVGEKKEIINNKLSFLNKEFKYVRYDDWLNYNNTKLNVKKYNSDKLLINIKSKNLSFIKNEFEEVKFELLPEGNIKFYFLCNKSYLQQVIEKNISNKNEEINYFIGSAKNDVKEIITNSKWFTHNDSNFEHNKDEIRIIYDNPGYSSHVHTFFDHDNKSFLVLNFKAKLKKKQNNNFFSWIGDSYGSDRKRLKETIGQEFNEYYLFHNSKFFSPDKKKFFGFDFRSQFENIIYIKDLKLNRLNINKKINLIKLTDKNLSNKNFYILVIEFKNLDKNNKTFKFSNPI